MPPHIPSIDALVVGGGPAALAIASELGQLGLGVHVVAPHPPQTFPATYGAWLDDLPLWAQGCTAQVWTDVRVHTGPVPTPLMRPYVLLDNAELLKALQARGEVSRWTIGQVTSARRIPEGWRVTGRSGEQWTARVVVDASGHRPALRSAQHPGGEALQTAYGIVARFSRPPCPLGAAVWMDYRMPHGPHEAPTFLYAMHLGGHQFFVEETSLIARPALSRAELRRRLHARLGAQGSPAREVLHEEWVAFPMNTSAPKPDGVLAFGAAAGLVHPISGFQVAGALHDAHGVAAAVAESFAAGVDPTAAGWAALWPAERRAARRLHLLGVDALLALPGDALPAFFHGFFALPSEQWRAFLDPHTAAGPLAHTMLRLFASLPHDLRLPLARAALTRPGSSLVALAAALTSPRTIP